METNPYEYDGRVPWIPQQNQRPEGRYVTARTYQQRSPVLPNQRPQQRGVEHSLQPPGRMPKARTLALAHTFKKWLIVASLASFGTFNGLIAYHQIGITPTQTSSGSSQKTAPATPSSSQNSNGFFKQQGGNNFGSNKSTPTPTSGSSNPTPTPTSESSGSSNSAPAPVSGSSVSNSH